jgi:ABC-type cobalt transport system substrate-binding protein
MVRKRKNSAFHRDAFAAPAQVERVDKESAIIKQHKSQSFLFGLMVGFILNTVLAVTLVSVQSEIDYKNSQAGIDNAIKIKIAEISTKLESMETPIYIPKSGEEAKELNENN